MVIKVAQDEDLVEEEKACDLLVLKHWGLVLC